MLLLPCRDAADADMSRIQDSGNGVQRVAAQLERPAPAAPADVAAGELQGCSSSCIVLMCGICACCAPAS